MDLDGTDGHAATRPDLTPRQHLVRIAGLAALAAALLGGLAARADVLFADGLRYITQARALEHDLSRHIVRHSVDHPAYPAFVAAAHCLIGGGQPDDWQHAAQLASVVAGVLLVVPLYLVAWELFGGAVALPACLLVFAVPLTGHVFADALSESTFLLFWTWGLWAALRFLKGGAFGWVVLVVAASGLAYLTRPEGLLLPAALVAALVLSPAWVARSLGRRGLAVLAALVVGCAAVVGPFVVLKGGLGTKPSVARLLGTAPHSAAQAVERQRPLDPDQTAATTYLLAVRAVTKAVSEATTLPLLLLAALGPLGMRREPGGGAVRQAKLLGVIWAAALLALVRLHATGGYCSPRHAMVLALLAIPGAAAGVGFLLDAAAGRLKTSGGGRRVAVRLGWGLALGAVLAANAGALVVPIGAGFAGYREAGYWLAGQARQGDASRVVDVTGWSQFYGERAGYTFANLIAAPGDPGARWVVAREAHLKGPWPYCQQLRALVDGLEPVQVFRGRAGRRPTRVYVFDRQPLVAAGARGAVRR